MANWLSALERKLGLGNGGAKRIKTFRWLIVIGLLGAMLMLVQSYISVKEIDPLTASGGSPPGQQQLPASTEPQPTAEFDTVEHLYEMKIKDILEKMVGVGTVDVLLSIESTEEIVYETNRRDQQQQTEETDRNGAKRHVSELTRDGEVVFYETSGNKAPLITKKMKPEIKGVFIVAGGAENATVRKMIKEAVQRAFHIPAYRISVAPRKQ